MIEVPEMLIAAERAAKAEFAEAHNAHQLATGRLDAARKAQIEAKNALDDWFARVLGRKA